MNASQRFDRDFADLLAELAQPQFPDYIDDVLVRAVGHRQRPAWTFPERWIPMGVLTRRLPLAPALPGRTVGLLTMLLLLLLATVVIGVGALLLQQRQQPAPIFGVAANGLYAYSFEEDIYTRDPATGEAKLVVGGPEVDLGPWFSRDGTMLTWVRVVPGEPEMAAIMAANPDGSNVRTLVPAESADEIHWWWPSPDGKTIGVINDAAHPPGLSMVDTATGVRTPIELPFKPLTFSWLASSDRLVVRGASATQVGLYVVGADGSSVRTLVEPGPLQQIRHTSDVSDDGRYLAYTSQLGGTLMWRLVAIETGEITSFPPPAQGHSAGPVFAPDSSRVAYVQYTDELRGEITAQPMIIALTEGASATPIGPAVRVPAGTEGLLVRFSPDGESLLIGADSGQVWLADLATGQYDELPWTKDDQPVSWQRRAP